MNIIDYDAVALRCYREINHSTSPSMLRVAYNYYKLFLKLLARNRVNSQVIGTIDKTITKAYKRRNQLLEPI